MLLYRAEIYNLLILVSMKTKNEKDPKLSVFTQPLKMKFRPQIDNSSFLDPSKPASPRFFQRLEGMFSRFSTNNIQQASSETMPSVSEISKITNSVSSIPEKYPVLENRLRYAFPIASNAILIGNKHQLDAIAIGLPTSRGYMNAEHLWSINLKTDILAVAVDQKKFENMCLATTKNLYFYFFPPKHIEIQPKMQKYFPLDEVPKHMYIIKEYLVCFFSKKFQIFIISEKRKKMSKKYTLECKTHEFKDWELFDVPAPQDNQINIFFSEEKQQNRKMFNLWYIHVEITNLDVNISEPKLAHQFKKKDRQKMKIDNYCKDIFVMSIGQEFVGISKGYIIDSVQIAKSEIKTKFIYLPDSTFFHIGFKKIDYYSFYFDEKKKPYRIMTQSKDSIQFPDRKGLLNTNSEEIFKIIQLGDNHAIIYQENPDKNLKSKGQLQYSIYVTIPIDRSKKVDEIFPKAQAGKHLRQVELFEKCTMVQKMGLKTKQIYLILWERSQKKTEEDFKLLLCTKDYSTIKSQILRLLKKTSLPLRKVKKIEESCFNMLQQFVQNPKCTQEMIIDFLKSHFFKRKIKLFIDLFRVDRMYCDQTESLESTTSQITITIQEYYQLDQMDIEKAVIDLVKQYCQSKQEKKKVKIRIFLRNFSFVYRTIYFRLLSQIIKAAKNNLPFLLENIPQLLPQFGQRPTEGIWSEITDQQWRDSLYRDTVLTVDTRNLYFNSVVKSLWFRRNLLTYHDTVDEFRQTIKKKAEQIKSDEIFYKFLCTSFEEMTDEKALRDLIYLVETNYKNLPSHICGKIFIYFQIFNYLKNQQNLPVLEKREINHFDEFLKLEDYEIFKHLFNIERSKHQILLNQVKPICFEEEKSDNFFNQSLLHYFISDLSEISDLKYILNRINNRKEEFHHDNQNLYEIMIQALKIKMKLGTDKDIPLEEVLIYINSIPIEKNRPAFIQLKLVEKIKKQHEMLAEAKVNMSIEEILNNQEELLKKLVDYQINIQKVSDLEGNDQETLIKFQNKAYKILAKVQSVSQSIYKRINSQSIFFLFVINLCEKQSFISKVDLLIHDQNLLQQGTFDESFMAEGVVQYMYKWKMIQCTTYIRGESYLRQLFRLLPEENPQRSCLENQLNLGLALSGYGINLNQSFPLSQGVFNSKDLEDKITDLPVFLALKLNPEKIHHYITQIQKVGYSKNSEQGGSVSEHSYTTLHRVTSIILLKYMKHGKLKETIPLLRSLLSLQCHNPGANIIYLIILYVEISNQLNDDNIAQMNKILCHLFFEPDKFLDLLEDIITNKRTVIQRKDFINETYSNLQLLNHGFFPNNELFNETFLQMAKEANQEKNFYVKITKTIQHLQKTKEEFKKIKYAVMPIIIINSPYMLASFIKTYQHLGLRYTRAFLSYLVQEQIFNGEAVLEFARRIFMLLCQSVMQNIPVEHLIKQYQNIPFTEQIQVLLPNPPTKSNQIEGKLWKSAEAFQKKKISLRKDREKKSRSESVAQKSERYRKQLTHAAKIQTQDPYKYIFSDSDDLNEEQEELRASKKHQKHKVHFDNLKQLNKLFSQRSGEPHKLLYHSAEIVPKKQIHSALSIEKPRKKQKAKLKVEEEHSLKFQANQLKESDLKQSEQVIAVPNEYQIHIKNVTMEIPKEKIQQIAQHLLQANMNTLIKNSKDFNLDPLREIADCKEPLFSVLQKIYSSIPVNIQRQNLISLFREINEEFSVLNIKPDILKIYHRIFQLERKHRLELPVEKIFVFEGLKESLSDSQELFKFISSHILEFLDDDNIFKVSKVIGLGLGTTSFQQQILFDFLLEKLSQHSEYSEAELRHFYQKIEALVHKIDAKTMINRMNVLFQKANSIGEKDRIQKMVTKLIEKIGSPAEKKMFYEKLNS